MDSRSSKSESDDKDDSGTVKPATSGASDEPKPDDNYAKVVPSVRVPAASRKKRSSKSKKRDEPDASGSAKHSKAPKDEPKAAESEAPEPGTGSAIAKQAWKIDATKLTLGQVLGEGAFGVVSRGKWRGKDVAVKQITKKALGDAKAVREFEAEIGRMASMQVHPNVVVLYGVVTLENGDLGAVMEYCAQGTLVTTLYGREKREWSEGELVEIAYDAACGLVHLHSQGIVHRDIAARNVLLAGKKDLVAKIADFGLSAEANAHNKEYKAAENGPFKWMAPEQLDKQKSSPASDVFAFGVLLFEIFARSAPWPEMNMFLVQIKVTAGERMEIPDTVPQEAARLMTACWAHEAKDRPAMKDVVEAIHRCAQ